jgi:selenide, water dikinase
VTAHSDLEILKGYFRVNDFMQSTSHPNVFAGGDCVTMETYADEVPMFPPKAGVYAVREGPFIA